MVQAYWQVGRLIVEHEQGRAKRTAYGEAVLDDLSRRLMAEVGRGFDVTNLRKMRQFYRMFEIRDALRLESGKAKRDAPRLVLGVEPIRHTTCDELSWSHYRLLMQVEKPAAREWYMSEAADQHWSTRQLDRQISVLYYERLLASRKKVPVRKEACEKLAAVTPEHFIRDPHVPEFLDLKDYPALRESAMEQVIIDNLQAFLLELARVSRSWRGRGGCASRGEEAVSPDIFPASVPYVALGHLHKPQSISGQTVIRYAGSPFPMSVAEKDYQHSIVVIDLDGTAGMKWDLVRTPRPVAFLRVPTVGAAPLSSVEDELRCIEIDDPGEHRRPFLEIVVRLDGPEPELRQRIEIALEGKPIRLTRIVRQTEGQGDALADTVEGDIELDEVEPAHVFARRHIEEYGVEPPADLRKAIDEVLTGLSSPDDDQVGGR